MTYKERLMAALKFEPTDRVPSHIIGGNSWIIKEDGISYAEQYAQPDVGAASIVQHFKEMNNGVVTCGNSGWMAWATAFGAEATLTEVGQSISVRPAVKDYKELPLDMSYSDLRELLLKNDIIKAMILQIKECDKLVQGEKALATGITAPFTSASTLLGAAAFLKLMRKHPEALPDLLGFTANLVAAIVDLYAEAGAEIVMVADPVASGDMISLDTYRSIAMPAYQKFMDTRTSDIPIILHICGNAGDRIESGLEMGVDVFSIDAMVDMEDMLRRADHRLCMMGSLSPTDQLMLGTPESVYKESIRLLELAEKNGGGFILSSGCDIPAGCPLENLQAMHKAAEDFAAK